MDGTWLACTEDGGARTLRALDEVDEALASVRDGVSEYVVIEREKDSETLFFEVSVWTRGVVLGRSFVADARYPMGNGFVQMELRTKRFEDIADSARIFLDGSRALVGRWIDVTDDYVGRSAS